MDGETDREWMGCLASAPHGAGHVRGGSGHREARGVMNIKDHIKSVCGTTDCLSLLLRGGDVLRYHVEGKRLQQQTVAEHTWRMLVVLLHLWPDSSRDLILAVLYHDTAECYTGDFPRNSKYFPDLQRVLDEMEKGFHMHVGLDSLMEDLEGQDLNKLKLVDTLEVYLTAKAQGARDVVVRAENILEHSILLLTDEDQELVRNLLLYA